jgi:HEAT repeat protein
MQQVALEVGTLPALLPLLQDADAAVRKKAVYAVSGACVCAYHVRSNRTRRPLTSLCAWLALVRDYPPAQTAFVEVGGLVLLRTAMVDDSAAVRTKAVFLLRNLCITDPALKDAGTPGTLHTPRT